MTRLSKEEIRKLGLQILKFVSNFCEENGIKYILSDGTLIGAVRHKGYIPWDMDIDISMLRADYDKFCSLWKDNDKYKLVCPETNTNSCLSFSKVVDKNTLTFEHGKKSVAEGMWIDIFPLDAVPCEKEQIDEHYNRLINLFDKYNRSYWISLDNNMLTRFLRKLKASIITNDIRLFFDTTYKRYKSLYNEAIKYNNIQYENVTNKMVIYNRSQTNRKYGFKKSCVEDFVYSDFEDCKFRIPKDYDELLQSYYGNYMELPPVEKRVDNHSLEVFYK